MYQNTSRSGDVQTLSIGFCFVLFAHVAGPLSLFCLMTTASTISILESALKIDPFHISAFTSIPNPAKYERGLWFSERFLGGRSQGVHTFFQL